MGVGGKDAHLRTRESPWARAPSLGNQNDSQALDKWLERTALTSISLVVVKANF